MKCSVVIGLGNISLRHRRNLKQKFPKMKVLAMSSSGRVPDEEIEDCDEFIYDFQTLIDKKPDLVIVASPATFHSKHAIPLIELGVPVLLEKPVTACTSDASDILQASEACNGLVAVGYCLRYLPSTVKIKELLSQSVIGLIYNASVNIGQFLPSWREGVDYRQSVSASAELGGGALLELSHELDYLQWLLGDLTLQHAYLRKSAELALEVEDIADLVLTTKSGCVCSVHLDFVQKQTQRKCSFLGSEGRLDWDLLKNTITLHKLDKDVILYTDEKWDKNGMYLSMLDDFILSVNGFSNNCVSIAEAAKTVALVEEIKKNATWGVI